jgi:hypothetical protein
VASNCIIVGRNNVVSGDCTGIVALNCNNMVFNASHNNKTFINNSFVTPKLSTTATGSSPTTVNGTYGMYYCDDTGGDVIINLGDPAIFIDCEFYFKRVISVANNIKFYSFGAELIEGAASPATLIPALDGCICLTTNGTDWFIKTKM